MTVIDFSSLKEPDKMPDFPPTEEQEAIIDTFNTGESMVVDAGAGVGKTSTLKLIGKANPNRTGVYIAFGKAIADEAKASFPANVRCSTAHSLAFRAVGKRYAHRLNGPRLPARVVAHMLNITEPLVLGDKELSPAQQARLVMETVDKFCHSADKHVTFWHVPQVNGLNGQAFYDLHEALLPLADEAWRDIISERGTLKFTHDNYLKIWALTDPKLPCDYILFDEAQDANPVLAHIVENQTHAQRILVGDENQAIYGWRGAKNAMEEFDGVRLQLTQSFRFGPAVADEANKWLSYLGARLRIRGYDAINSRVESLTEPRAILCRTNAGAVTAAVVQMAMGRRAALVGGSDSIRRLALAAADLQAGQRTEHPELFMFETWSELQEYVKEDSAGTDLRVFVKLIDDMGWQQVVDACDRLVDERVADVTISTAHKSKGREWETVQINGDFFQPKDEDAKLPREEAMLAYVAVTRAKQVLDRSGLSWVDELVGAGE